MRRDFKRTVLIDALPLVEKAWELYLAETKALYQKHEMMGKIAARRNSPELRRAADSWLHEAELVAATKFDRVYLKAQTDRLEKNKRNTNEIREILRGVCERYDAAVKALPEVLSRLEAANAGR